MRLLGLVIVALLLQPAAALADDSFEYLTTYVGVYSFKQDEVAQPGRPDGLHTQQDYAWVTYDYDRVTVHGDGTYASRHTRFISAHGHIKQVQIQGSDLMGGPFTTTTDCTIKSALTPVITEGGGSNVQPIPISKDPSISVGWNIPDYGSARTNDAPPFTLMGTAGNGMPCSTEFGNSFLQWTATSPGATVFTALPTTSEMTAAFGGAENIRYHQITGRFGYWDRKFKNLVIKNAATRPGFHGDATETAQVMVDSRVIFERINHKSRLNKIGALLQSEGLLGVEAQGFPAGPADPYADDPSEQILVPGIGTGDESLDVTGRVLSGRAAAAADTLFATGTGKATGAASPVRLTVRLTAAGRALLAAPHPAIPVTYILHFRPRGSKKTYTAKKALTIPPAA